DEIERGPYRPLGVVLLRDRRPPDGHDRVADELLHRAAVDLDQAAAAVEIAREELAHLLGVARLRQGREADEVGEEDGDEPALGSRLRRSRLRRHTVGERRAALAAETHPRLVRGAARRAADRERRAALPAELPPCRVLEAAL